VVLGAARAVVAQRPVGDRRAHAVHRRALRLAARAASAAAELIAADAVDAEAALAISRGFARRAVVELEDQELDAVGRLPREHAAEEEHALRDDRRAMMLDRNERRGQRRE